MVWCYYKCFYSFNFHYQLKENFTDFAGLQFDLLVFSIPNDQRFYFAVRLILRKTAKYDKIVVNYFSLLIFTTYLVTNYSLGKGGTIDTFLSMTGRTFTVATTWFDHKVCRGYFMICEMHEVARPSVFGPSGGHGQLMVKYLWSTYREERLIILGMFWTLLLCCYIV